MIATEKEEAKYLLMPFSFLSQYPDNIEQIVFLWRTPKQEELQSKSESLTLHVIYCANQEI